MATTILDGIIRGELIGVLLFVAIALMFVIVALAKWIGKN